MKYFEAPNDFEGDHHCLFLAGGISNCPNWQDDLRMKLEEDEIVLLNPRRIEYNISDKELDKQQITWEFKHLRRADAISFWFPKETLCPITLFELGTWITSDKPIFVGVHPEYQRKRDVEIQTRLARPDVEIVYDLHFLADQIKAWVKKEKIKI